MSLQKTLEEIKVLKPIAEEDVNSGPRETYAGREGRKRNAVSRLKDLKEQYINELRLSAVFVLVVGSAKNEFAKVAKEEFKCFTSDPEGFYKDLANRLPPVLYSQKTPPSNLFDIMGRHLEDKATEMQITGYPQLYFNSKYQRACNGKEEFIGLIKEAINDQIGSEISSLHTVRALADEAIESGHVGPNTAIVLTTDDEKLALDLKNTANRIGAKAFLVAAGKGGKTVKATEGAFAVKEVTTEVVEKILKNIRDLCR